MIDKELFPILEWNEKYSHMGVTPRELYMRQNGLCWLVPETGPNGEVVVYCTDGTERAKTSSMLNPTFECAKCISGFAERIIRDAQKINGQEKEQINTRNDS